MTRDDAIRIANEVPPFAIVADKRPNGLRARFRNLRALAGEPWNKSPDFINSVRRLAARFGKPLEEVAANFAFYRNHPDKMKGFTNPRVIRRRRPNLV